MRRKRWIPERLPVCVISRGDAVASSQGNAFRNGFDPRAYNVRKTQEIFLTALEIAGAQNKGDQIRGHLLLPDNQDSDKILRYETMIRKQLNHAFSELERLQRRRCGKCVPDQAWILISETKPRSLLVSP